MVKSYLFNGDNGTNFVIAVGGDTGANNANWALQHYKC